MPFVPPYCPNGACRHRRTAISRSSAFFRRKGSFARLGDRRVARFQCKICGRHFSEQTFRVDYRWKRPELDMWSR